MTAIKAVAGKRGLDKHLDGSWKKDGPGMRHTKFFTVVEDDAEGKAVTVVPSEYLTHLSRAYANYRKISA